MRTKIIAEKPNKNIPDTSCPWRIWDNGDVEYFESDSSSWVPRKFREMFEKEQREAFLKNLKQLPVGKKFCFYEWVGDFQDCFSVDREDIEAASNEDICLIFYGFGPVKCRECNFDVNGNVCNNCGEWQND